MKHIFEIVILSTEPNRHDIRTVVATYQHEVDLDPCIDLGYSINVCGETHCTHGTYARTLHLHDGDPYYTVKVCTYLEGDDIPDLENAGWIKKAADRDQRWKTF